MMIWFALAMLLVTAAIMCAVHLFNRGSLSASEAIVAIVGIAVVAVCLTLLITGVQVQASIQLVTP